MNKYINKDLVLKFIFYYYYYYYFFFLHLREEGNVYFCILSRNLRSFEIFRERDIRIFLNTDKYLQNF
jgi:hypothetical protein